MKKVYYYNITKRLNGRPQLLPLNEDISKHIDRQTDYYRSVYHFEDHHKNLIEQTKSIAGITDVTTNTIIFDFDGDLEEARKDAVETIRRLISKYKVNANDIKCYFSGGKGFHLELETNNRFTPGQHRSFAMNLANDLKTFDTKVYNAVRVLRVVNTRHQDTGLYKIPLTSKELRDVSISDIKFVAKAPRVIELTTNPVDIIFAEEKKKEEPIVKKSVIDWDKKPKWLSNCRFALQNGLFKEGMRSNALSCLAATYKAQGFSEEHCRSFLEATCKIQAQENDCEAFPEEELDNVIRPVYSSTWKGGIYTCKEPGWLNNYCEGLGHHCCNKSAATAEDVVRVDDIVSFFDTFVNDLDKNVINTGIGSLDQKIKFMVGTSNFIIGSPGVGKTSLILQILKHNSEKDINSLFFSYDMFHAALYIRMLNGISGLTQDALFDIFKNGGDKKDELQSVINEQYQNVNFCFKAGQTIDELEQSIIDNEEQTGKKLKLVVVDYNELIVAKSSEPTQASAEVAQALRRIANERQVCVITLLQPSKMYSSPADEVRTYLAAKGSASLGQSATVILGINRPGYNPLNMGNDNYFTITCLKNRGGGLFFQDYQWDGVRGQISELQYGDEEILSAIRSARDEEKKKTDQF